MIVHQTENSIKNYNYNACIYRDTSFYKHFHRNYELIYVTAGKIHVASGKTDSSLSEGELLLISPYTIHSFDIDKTSEAWVAVFSDDFIASFSQSNKTVEYSKFRCDPEKEAFLKRNLFFAGKPEHYTLIACLYLACSDCIKNAVPYDKDRDGIFMYKIIDCISKNLNSNITLESIADELGYEKHYFSSLFNKCFSMNFCGFVNMFKFESACRLLADKALDTTYISMACGFGSVRNFNRVFKQISGMTPGEYRKYINDGSMHKRV